jgi:hypothetical protein
MIPVRAKPISIAKLIVIIPREKFELLKAWQEPKDVRKVKRYKNRWHPRFSPRVNK